MWLPSSLRSGSEIACQICLRSIPNSLLRTRRGDGDEGAISYTDRSRISSSHGEDGPVLPDSFSGLDFWGVGYSVSWITKTNYFCLLVALSIFTFGIFLILDTFHQRRWSTAWSRCQTLKELSLGFHHDFLQPTDFDTPLPRHFIEASSVAQEHLRHPIELT